MFRNSLDVKLNPSKDDINFQIVDWYSDDINMNENVYSESELEEMSESELIEILEDQNRLTEGSKYQLIKRILKPELKYYMKVFGVSKEGYSVGLTIEDFKPYFYIDLKGVCLSNDKEFHQIKRIINDKLGYKCDIISIKRDTKINLYGFTNNEPKYLMKLTFDNLRSYKTAMYNLHEIDIPFKKKVKVKQYESNIEPMIRFMHKKNVKPSGWIELKAGKYAMNSDILEAKTNIDLQVNWKYVKAFDNSSIAPLVVASYDIECTSSHGDFPMAIKSYKKTARELYEYYKSLISKNMIRREIGPLILKQIYGLFNVDGETETVLSYVVPKKSSTIDKEKIKKEAVERVDDILKIMKDKPQTEKNISDYMKLQLKIEDTSSLIKNMKNKYEMLTRFKKSKSEIEGEILSLVYSEYAINKTDTEETKTWKHAMINKVYQNSQTIMALFDKDTVFDKISKEFVKMGCPKLEGDPVIQIGTTFHIYGQTECFYKHIITLKDCEDNFDVDEIVECNSEKQVLTEWKKLIQTMDPDILTGYNIFGFDNGYLRDRSIELKCSKSFEQLGRFKNFNYDEKKPGFITKELQSSALGQNILKYFSMEGRVQVDIMKIVQKDYKLDTYKLDFVASTFINGKVKKVISNNKIIIDNISGLYSGNFIKLNDKKFRILTIDENTKEITIENDQNYDICNLNVEKWGMVKDDISPNEIFEAQNKGSLERAKIAKYCIQDCALCNYLLMKLEIITNNIGMSNVCLVPLSYIFLRGQGIKIFSLVAKQCLDDGFIIPVVRKVDDDTEESYEGAIVLEPDIGIYEDPVSVLDFASLYPSSMISENISHDSIVLDKKYDNLPGIEYNDISYDVNGVNTVVRFAQFKNNEKGVLPRILMKLLSQRKLTRKKMLYKSIIYGDDDKSFEGLVIKDDNEIVVLKDLSNNESVTVERREIKSIKDTYNEFEKAVLDGLQLAYKITANSLYGQVGARTSPIFLKELAASTTATGRNLVLKLKDFAEDNYDCKVVYGDSVLPNTPIIVKYNDQIHLKTIDKLNDLTNTTWETYDRFIKEGTNKEKSDVSNIEVWTHDGWKQIKKVIRHKCKKKIYRVLTHTGLVDVTEDHSLLNTSLEEIKPSDVKIGTELFHLSPHIEDYEIGNDLFNNISINNINNSSIIVNDQLTAQSYYIYLTRLGCNVSIDYNNESLFKLTFSKSEFRKNANEIKKVELLYDSYEDYVYDIETEAGTFHAGIGNMIVKNTDSIFIKFLSLPDENGEEYKGKDRLQASIDKSIELSAAFKPHLKNPHDAEYEKTFWPFIIMSKKRYVGNLYEEDVNKYKQKSMGIVLKRRDNANILKKVYGGMIDIILNENNVDKSIKFLQNELKGIEDGKVDIKDLVITKTLKGSYADPSKIAHKVLADRMFDRDPGSAPQVNDRVPYVYIYNKNKKALQGDKIENPEYILKNKVKIDYSFYITNQIMKPVSQLLSLRVENISGYKKSLNHFDKLYDKYLKEYKNDKTKTKDKINALKEEEVENLIFKQVLLNIEKKAKNQTSISDFW